MESGKFPWTEIRTKLKRKAGCGGLDGKSVRPTISAGSCPSVKQEAEEKPSIIQGRVASEHVR